MEHHIDQIRIEYLRNLISSSNNASSRSRTTYFILSLTCFFILIGVFNMELSWERHINFKEREQLGFNKNLYPTDSGAIKILSNNLSYEDASEKSKKIFDAYLQNISNNYTYEFFKRYEVTIPILGIRVFSSDLSVISSTSILILITWLFYSIRREYHIVDKIKQEFSSSDSFLEIRKMIYYGSVFENVFVTATKNSILNQYQSHNSRFRKFIKWTISPLPIMFILRIFPALTIFITMSSDIIPLLKHNDFFYKYQFEILTREIYSFLLFIMVTQLIFRNAKFDKKITKDLAYMNSNLVN